MWENEDKFCSNLPKINERKQLSKKNQTLLRLEFQEAIMRFEKENSYKFEPYEVDNVLLEMVIQNHKSYLRGKFGNETIG